MHRTALFELVFPCFFTVLVSVALVYQKRASRAGKNDWNSLLQRLERLDREALTRISSDRTAMMQQVQNDSEESGRLEADEIWGLIGGLKGIEALERNSVLLVEFACHVQRQYPEAILVAEQLRLSAREIQWHLDRLRGAQKVGHLRSAFPDYAQQAIVAYVKMVALLLELCEKADSPGFQDLRRAT